jgi:hypothetical protein
MEETLNTFGFPPSDKTTDAPSLSVESKRSAQKYNWETRRMIKVREFKKGTLNSNTYDDLTREEEEQIKRAYGF